MSDSQTRKIAIDKAGTMEGWESLSLQQQNLYKVVTDALAGMRVSEAIEVLANVTADIAANGGIEALTVARIFSAFTSAKTDAIEAKTGTRPHCSCAECRRGVASAMKKGVLH